MTNCVACDGPIRISPSGKRWCRACKNRASRKWRQRHPEQIRAINQRRKKIIHAAQIKYQLKYPERYKAKKMIARRVYRGTIIKPDACEKCGKVGPVQAHHRDYSKPLEVIWLCTTCHGKEHIKPAIVGPLRNGHNKWKTHCIRGHEYTPENTYWLKNARTCRTCRAMFSRNWNAKIKKATAGGGTLQ